MNPINDIRNILLTVSYDGRRFCGWQKQLQNGQETFRTVQGELEKALFKLHKHKIDVNAAGRTDSGVHAVGQAVNFYTDIKKIPAENFIPALNSILPCDIRIVNSQEVSKLLHARFNALFRTYRYYIKCGNRVPAHEMPYCWNIRRYPDITTLNSLASCLHGEMDCSVFSVSGDQSLSTSRYIKHAVFFEEKDCLVFEISANAFLWKMVRSILGTILYCEENNVIADDFKILIADKKRKSVFPTAPPEGLFFWSVEYPNDLLTPVSGLR